MLVCIRLYSNVRMLNVVLLSVFSFPGSIGQLFKKKLERTFFLLIIPPFNRLDIQLDDMKVIIMSIFTDRHYHPHRRVCLPRWEKER